MNRPNSAFIAMKQSITTTPTRPKRATRRIDSDGNIKRTGDARARGLTRNKTRPAAGYRGRSRSAATTDPRKTALHIEDPIGLAPTTTRSGGLG